MLEKLFDYGGEIDLVRLFEYVKYYSQVTTKFFGLLLGLVGINSKKKEKLVNRKPTSKLSKKSDKFSNKWRLYYDSVLDYQLT